MEIVQPETTPLPLPLPSLAGDMLEELQADRRELRARAVRQNRLITQLSIENEELRTVLADLTGATDAPTQW